MRRSRPDPTPTPCRFGQPARMGRCLRMARQRASSDAPTYPQRGGGTRSMEREERSDRGTTIEERFSGYEVYDQNYEKIGKVDYLFVDENDNPEYIGVKMGFLGTRSTLIPMDMVRVNDERHLLQVAADKDRVKDGPTFDDDRDITPEFENEVYSYYGLQRASTTEERRATYGAYQEGGQTAGSASEAPTPTGAADRGGGPAEED